MLFSVGTRVKFLHSKDAGVVTALLSGEMVNVLLDESGLEIPAFVDDLIRSEDYIDQNPSVKAKIVPGKKNREPIRPDMSLMENQYAVLKSIGIQLAFDPKIKSDATVDQYELFLINDTKFDILYNIELKLRNKTPRDFNGKLDAMSYVSLSNFLFDDLNDAPTFNCDCWRISTDGKGPVQHKLLKIKPKQFFKKQRTAPFLNRPVHLFILFEKLVASENQEKKEDLKTYTKRNSTPLKKNFPKLHYYKSPDVNEVASFIPEIDLHIEKIAPDSGLTSNRDILHLQIQHFEQFIAKAIRLGIQRVFVIHGVGKGKLRDTIASQLIQMPEVLSFKNEFHERYGYGATEVLLNV